MIRFDLRCGAGHDFDSWFASGEAFDRLRHSRKVSCPACGSTEVEKALMAPRVRPSRKASETAVSMATPDPEIARAMQALRTHVEKTTDDVGDRFAAEARAMHLGDRPERAIRGRASRDEAKSLLEDGVPVMPLPFIPTRDTH